MKKITIILSLAILTLATIPGSNQVSAQTSTPSSTPKSESALDKVRILKDKVATKVAQLRKTDKKGLLGTVADITDSTLTLKTQNSDAQINFTQDSPVFSLLNKRQEVKISDIENGSSMLAIGFYDGQEKVLDARVLYLIPQPPSFLLGKIADINRENFTITIKANDSKDSLVDIETFTRTQTIDSKNNTQKSGFSKLTTGDSIQVIGTKSKKEENRYSAIRILVVESKNTGTPTPNAN